MASTRLLQGIAAFVHGRHAWRIDYQIGGWQSDISRWRRHLDQWKPDGIIAMVEETPQADALAAAGKPCVFLMSTMPGRKETVVRHDDVLVGRMAADHLVERGLKRFGYVGFSHSVSHNRARGFHERLAEKRLPCSLIGGDYRDPLQEKDWKEIWDMSFLAQAVRRLEPPVGLLAFNDLMATRILDATWELGLKVPDDIAIIGVDNEESYCAFSRIDLTSVELNLHGVGFQAARQLAGLLDGGQAKSAVSLVPPLRVVTRQSTAVRMLDDPEVAAALRDIRENALGGIDVEKVAANLMMSRRSLEQRFCAAIGHGPGEEIRRTRIEHACALLVETDMKLIEIAIRCGFDSPSNFSRSFRREKGVKPSQYRSSNPRVRKFLG